MNFQVQLQWNASYKSSRSFVDLKSFLALQLFSRIHMQQQINSDGYSAKVFTAFENFLEYSRGNKKH